MDFWTAWAKLGLRLPYKTPMLDNVKCTSCSLIKCSLLNAFCRVTSPWCSWVRLSPRIRVDFLLIFGSVPCTVQRQLWHTGIFDSWQSPLGCLVRAQQRQAHTHTHTHTHTHRERLAHRSRRRANCTLNKPACHNNDESRLHYVLLSLFLWFTAVKATHAWDGLQGCCQGEFNVLGFSVFLGACHIGSALTGIPAGTSGIVNINRILIPPKHCGGILMSSKHPPSPSAGLNPPPPRFLLFHSLCACVLLFFNLIKKKKDWHV